MSVQVYNGKIYAAGGEFGHDVYKLHQRIFQVYDPTNNTWTRLADAPISKSHAESSAFIRNGKFIWAGGQTYGSPDGQAGTSNVVAYDFASGRWSTLNPLPAARQGATVKAVGNVVVIANGGVTTYQPQRTVWIGNLS
jgi:N-acetylneuraminic acid mutarotase